LPPSTNSCQSTADLAKKTLAPDKRAIKWHYPQASHKTVEELTSNHGKTSFYLAIMGQTKNRQLEQGSHFEIRLQATTQYHTGLIVNESDFSLAIVGKAGEKCKTIKIDFIQARTKIAENPPAEPRDDLCKPATIELASLNFKTLTQMKKIRNLGVTLKKRQNGSSQGSRKKGHQIS